MATYSLIVVEGPHDVELVYRLLSPFGLKRVQLKATLESFWYDLIPTKFPHNEDLQKRMPVPVFMQNENHSIAIHSAVGDSRLAESVQESCASLKSAEQLTGVGVVLDADSGKTAADRYTSFAAKLLELGYALSENPGEVIGGSPQIGAFVLPDNNEQGTLEDILLECAGQVYPELLTSAQTHVANAANVIPGLATKERKHFEKPAGSNKATIGSIANILRPGKSVQVSVQDNRWLRDAQLDIPRVKAIQEFLKTICGIE